MDLQKPKLATILDHSTRPIKEQTLQLENPGPTIPIFYQRKNLSVVGHAAKEATIAAIRIMKGDEILTNDELDMVWNELNATARKNEEGDNVTQELTYVRLSLTAPSKN